MVYCCMGTDAETILQFGGGNFLRSFADTFVHEANERGQDVGRVVVVTSTASLRAELINRQGGRYHVVVRGLVDGKPVNRVQEVASIRRALDARTQWEEVLECARSPALRWIISNTTEAGYDLDDTDGPDRPDRPDRDPPRSFPAKLLEVLYERFRAGQAAPTIVPCELLERNADRLASIVGSLAVAWSLGADFERWLAGECVWLNTLVDRIVTGRPKAHPLLQTDELLTAAEPFALWVIEENRRSTFFEHEAIVRAKDVGPYHLRKVRLLNGAHTALVAKARPLGFKTVRQAVEDRGIGPWIRDLLFEEIVPTLDGRVDDVVAFARQTLERFRNPFVEHKLADIALHHETKIKVRLLPTMEEYMQRFGKTPARLAELLA